MPMDDMARSVESASKAIEHITGIFPKRTAGILTRKLRDFERAARGRLWLASLVVILPARLAWGVALIAAVVVGLYWSTFGSVIVMAAGPSLVFGPSPNPRDDLGVGILMAAANGCLALFAGAYILHLLF